jgi:hypothetical protein
MHDRDFVDADRLGLVAYLRVQRVRLCDTASSHPCEGGLALFGVAIWVACFHFDTATA